MLLVENPMDVHFLLKKCFFIIYIACLHIPSAESGMRLRTGWRREAGWTSILHSRPLAADTERQHSTLPEGRQGTDMGPLHGGFGGYTRRKNVKRRRLKHFGQFNSDTRGCNGIQTRSCSTSSHCTGCFGLYTCNLTLGKCQLKGLSQQTDTFLQTLRDS